VVAKVTGESASKSGELAGALSGDKKIVVCTIQTFPFALEAVREMSATKGKRFAVIADEAHSSQAGEAAAKLKAVLSPEEIKEIGDGGEVMACLGNPDPGGMKVYAPVGEETFDDIQTTEEAQAGADRREAA